MRVGPVAIPNGTFGHRPHCIYRGFCLQGCKVNAKALAARHPHPRRARPRRRGARPVQAARVEVEGDRRATGVTYVHDGASATTGGGRRGRRGTRSRPAAAAARACAGLPDGLGNATDQVGRYSWSRAPRRCRALRRAAPCGRRRRRDLLRAVLRDRPTPGFARGFSIETVGPLPIAWAEHVLADGHWGRACASTCATTATGRSLGPLCELLPQGGNRVTLDEHDSHGMPVARIDYTQCDNDRRQHRLRQGDAAARSREAAEAQDTLSIDRTRTSSAGRGSGVPAGGERALTATSALLVLARQQRLDQRQHERPRGAVRRPADGPGRYAMVESTFRTGRAWLPENFLAARRARGAHQRINV